MVAQRPNVILIVMDTVRADHLSCYGYSRETTPCIDKIAEKGIIFENAFSAGIWSPPSHASIFTGKYPSYHGTLGRNVCLNKENTTLAEIFRRSNYKTIGITNCRLLWPGSGFERGFERFVLPSRTSFRSVKSKTEDLGFIFSSFVQGPRNFTRTLVNGPDSYTSYTNEIIKDFLGRHGLSSPFFLFVNYFNCHAPYDPPRPFKGRFLDNFHEPSLFFSEFLLEKIFGSTGERIKNSNLDIKKLHYLASGSCKGRFSFMAKELEISKKEWEVIRSWYDGEIAYLDHCIGDIINYLHDTGLYDHTLIVITADHGESLGEHGLAGHHFGLYDSLLHIPLVVSYPMLTSGAERITEIVSSIDILPTILSACNINVNVDIQGESLWPLEEQRFHKFVCAECGESVTKIQTNHFKRVFSRFSQRLEGIDVGYKSIRDDIFKYIISAKGEEQLFDVSNDPSERENIIDEFPNKAKNLKRRMGELININYFGPMEIVGTESEKGRIIERLRSLGYI